MLALPLIAILFAVAVYNILTYTRRRKTGPSGEKLPVGPPAKPLIGNLLDLPKQHAWAKFHEWSKEYGPLFSFDVFGQTQIVICKESIAEDLLRERGNIYSSRPPFQMAGTLISGNMRPVLLPYDTLWRNGRKFAHTNINSRMAHIYEPVQTDESVRVLHDLLRKPTEYSRWFDRYAAGLVMRIAYSKFVFTGEEDYLKRTLEGVVRVERSLTPGLYLVDIFPSLMNLPDFLAPFKRQGKKFHADESELFMSLLKEVEAKVDKGELETENFSSKFIANKSQYKLSDKEASYLIGTLFEAGAGTTSTALVDFLLAAVHYPDAYKKLQDEVDRVVGSARLPALEDMENLPYVRACAKETVRWRPVIEGGIPHYTTDDDTYTLPSGKKVFIPKNSVVHVNQWSLRSDASVYPRPDDFIPERYLEPGWPTYKAPLTKYPDMHNFFIFGHGRRVCPGQHIAERSLYLLISRIAWACDITKKRRPDGSLVTPSKFEYEWGGAPPPFEFELTPRAGRSEVVEGEYERVWAPRLEAQGVATAA